MRWTTKTKTMCNCIKDLEYRLENKLKGTEDMGRYRLKNASLITVGVTHSALMIADWKYKLQIPFTAKWKLQSGRQKDVVMNVIASHCPFCGVKLEESKNNQAEP